MNNQSHTNTIPINSKKKQIHQMVYKIKLLICFLRFTYTTLVSYETINYACLEGLRVTIGT